MIDRRMVLGGGSALLIGAGTAWAAPSASRLAVAAIEAPLGGGRLGFAAIDTGSGRRIASRENERFAMASTFKLPLAAAVLAQVDSGKRRLDETIPFTPADLLDHAPYVRAHPRSSALPIGGLMEAAVVLSDNTAANLLLPIVGGPAGLTGFVRAQGDRVTRLDRNEPELNSNLPGDVRDTTTPAAMAGLLQRLLVGPVLTPASRDRLTGWMVACETGKTRLRAGIPQGWRAGDKTGTGMRGGTGDIAILWPPRRPPIIVACYIDAANAPAAVRDAAYAAIGGLIAGTFA
jgi:beta-lactamase class A